MGWYVGVPGAVARERYEMDGKIGHAELDLHGNTLCLADMSPGPRPEHYNDVPSNI